MGKWLVSGVSLLQVEKYISSQFPHLPLQEFLTTFLFRLRLLNVRKPSTKTYQPCFVFLYSLADLSWTLLFAAKFGNLVGIQTQQNLIKISKRKSKWSLPMNLPPFSYSRETAPDSLLLLTGLHFPLTRSIMLIRIHTGLGV